MEVTSSKAPKQATFKETDIFDDETMPFLALYKMGYCDTAQE